jgi:hypothetical protein
MTLSFLVAKEPRKPRRKEPAQLPRAKGLNSLIDKQSNLEYSCMLNVQSVVE